MINVDVGPSNLQGTIFLFEHRSNSHFMMATTQGLTEVQDLIAYQFQSIPLLILALTAAGADDKVYDGNRKLAQLGEALIELLLTENAFMAGLSRGRSSLFHQYLRTNICKLM